MDDATSDSGTHGESPPAPSGDGELGRAAPSPAQVVGSSLRSARISGGHSLESVRQHTRIPCKYIAALEAGRFYELPAPVYLHSFLKSYCEYLDVAFEPLWEKLHPPPPVSAPAAPAPGSPEEPQRPVPAQLQLKISPYLAALAAARGPILLTLALALSVVVWVARGRKAGPTNEDFQRAQALRPAVEPKLAIVFRDEAWLRLKADGELVFEGRVPKNARQEWRAQKSLQLRTPQPESLELTLNGARFRLPRPEGNGEYRIESP